MKKMMTTLAVATGLLAVPFTAALAETTVTDSRTAIESSWHGAELGVDAGSVLGEVHGTTNFSGDAATAHIAASGSVWADNYEAGRVFAPADH